MTGIHLGDVLPALDNPEPTAQKLGRQWGQGIDWERVAAEPAAPEAAEVAPLDPAALTRKYGPERAYAPRWETATFRAPLGMRGPQFQRLAYEQTTRWLDEQKRRGFDVCSGSRVEIKPGPYPSRDVATGLSLPGYRDFLIQAQFVERSPTVQRIELAPELLAATRLSQLPTSSGEET